MGKIKAAVIGCGGVHNVHAKVLSNLDTAELTAVCDIIPEKAEKSSREYGAKIMSFEEILGDQSIQSVHICTPHFLHAEMAIRSMEAGKMVLLEKPLALNLNEAKQVKSTEQSTNAHFGVCFQNRYRPVVRKMHELIQGGSLGRLLGGKAFVTWKRDDAYYKSVDWRGSWEKEGGSLLINQTIHTLDLLQWLFGGVRDVSGIIDHHVFGHVIETEDTAELRLITNSGCPILFYATTGYAEDSAVLIEVIAENAKLRSEEDLTIIWKNGAKETITEEQAAGPKAYWGVQHETIIRDFYRSYIEGEKFAIGASEAIKTMEILDMIYNNPAINRCK